MPDNKKNLDEISKIVNKTLGDKDPRSILERREASYKERYEDEKPSTNLPTNKAESGSTVTPANKAESGSTVTPANKAESVNIVNPALVSFAKDMFSKAKDYVTDKVEKAKEIQQKETKTNPYAKSFAGSSNKDNIAAKNPEDLIDIRYGDIEKQNYISWGKSQGYLKDIDDNLLKSASTEGLKELLKQKGATTNGLDIIGEYGKNIRLDNKRINEGVYIMGAIYDEMTNGGNTWNPSNKDSKVYNEYGKVEENGKKSVYIANTVNSIIKKKKDWNNLYNSINSNADVSRFEKIAFNIGYQTGSPLSTGKPENSSNNYSSIDLLNSVNNPMSFQNSVTNNNNSNNGNPLSYDFSKGEGVSNREAGIKSIENFNNLYKEYKLLLDKESEESFSSAFLKSGSAFFTRKNLKYKEADIYWNKADQNFKDGDYLKGIGNTLHSDLKKVSGTAYNVGGYVYGLLGGTVKRGVVDVVHTNRDWASGLSYKDASRKAELESKLSPVFKEFARQEKEKIDKDPYRNSDEYKDFRDLKNNWVSIANSKNVPTTFKNRKAHWLQNEMKKDNVVHLGNGKFSLDGKEMSSEEYVAYSQSKSSKFDNLENIYKNYQKINNLTTLIEKGDYGIVAGLWNTETAATDFFDNLGAFKGESVGSKTDNLNRIIQKRNENKQLTPEELKIYETSHKVEEMNQQLMQNSYYSVGATTKESAYFAAEFAIQDLIFRGVGKTLGWAAEELLKGTKIGNYNKAVEIIENSNFNTYKKMEAIKALGAKPQPSKLLDLMDAKYNAGKNLIEKGLESNLAVKSIIKAPKYVLFSKTAPSTSKFKMSDGLSSTSLEEDEDGNVVELRVSKTQNKIAMDNFERLSLLARNEISELEKRKEIEGAYFKDEDKIEELHNKLTYYNKELDKVRDENGYARNGLVDNSLSTAFSENFWEEHFLGTLFDEVLSPKVKKWAKGFLEKESKNWQKMVGRDLVRKPAIVANNVRNAFADRLGQNKLGRFSKEFITQMNLTGEQVQSVGGEIFSEMLGSVFDFGATPEEYAEGIANNFNTDFATQVAGSTILTNLLVGGARTTGSFLKGGSIYQSLQKQTANEFLKSYLKNGKTEDLLELLRNSDNHSTSRFKNDIMTLMTVGANKDVMDLKLLKASLDLDEAINDPDDVNNGKKPSEVISSKITPELKKQLLDLAEKQVLTTQTQRAISINSKAGINDYRKSLNKVINDVNVDSDKRLRFREALSDLNKMEAILNDKSINNNVKSLIVNNELAILSNNKLIENLEKVANSTLLSGENREKLKIVNDKIVSSNNLLKESSEKSLMNVIDNFQKMNEEFREGFFKKMENDGNKIDTEKLKKDKVYATDIDMQYNAYLNSELDNYIKGERERDAKDYYYMYELLEESDKHDLGFIHSLLEKQNIVSTVKDRNERLRVSIEDLKSPKMDEEVLEYLKNKRVEEELIDNTEVTPETLEDDLKDSINDGNADISDKIADGMVNTALNNDIEGTEVSRENSEVVETDNPITSEGGISDSQLIIEEEDENNQSLTDDEIISLLADDSLDFTEETSIPEEIQPNTSDVEDDSDFEVVIQDNEKEFMDVLTKLVNSTDNMTEADILYNAGLLLNSNIDLSDNDLIEFLNKELGDEYSTEEILNAFNNVKKSLEILKDTIKTNVKVLKKSVRDTKAIKKLKEDLEKVEDKDDFIMKSMTFKNFKSRNPGLGEQELLEYFKKCKL